MSSRNTRKLNEQFELIEKELPGEVFRNFMSGFYRLSKTNQELVVTLICELTQTKPHVFGLDDSMTFVQEESERFALEDHKSDHPHA